MFGNFKVVTLCGSTKYKDDYESVAKELELKENIIVLRTSVFSHHDGIELTKEEEERCVEKFKELMRHSDEVHAVVVNDYIGNHTRTDIEFGESIGKPIVLHKIYHHVS